MARPSWDQHFLNIAKECATMGTCSRRQVGCVLVDERKNILSTGFNGVPPKWDHCRDNENAKCPGANAPSGTSLDSCWANHAEQNALAHCTDRMRIHTCYTTTSCCVTCVKELLHTSCCRIVFLEEYSQPEAKLLWTKTSLLLPTRSGMIADHRTWEQVQDISIDQVPAWKTIVLASSGVR
jgi:dCMP deaminase